MPREVTYKCDICGTIRGPSNHWFCAWIYIPTVIPSIEIKPFDEKDMDYSGIKILCGEACVHKFISQNLAALHTSAARSDAPHVDVEIQYECTEQEDVSAVDENTENQKLCVHDNDGDPVCAHGKKYFEFCGECEQDALSATELAHVEVYRKDLENEQR